MQSKTTMRYCCNTFLVGMQNYRATLKKVCQFLEKLNRLILLYLAIVLLDIYTKEMDTFLHSKTLTWVFVEIHLYLQKVRDNPLNEPIDWYLHTKDYYLAIKKIDVLNHSTTWINIKCILLSERSHRFHSLWFHLYDHLEKVKL